MKKSTKIIIFIIILLVIIGTFAIYIFTQYQKNMLSSIRGIVMEVYENSLSVMGIEAGNEPGSLYSVSFAKDGNIGFKQGQEVLIYFDGIVADSFPAQIHNVGKIEIVAEQSEVEIPDDVTRYYNNTQDKV